MLTPLSSFPDISLLLYGSFFIFNSLIHWKFIPFLINFILFIYLFLAALGLRCCAQAFSSCGERGLLFFAVCGLSLVAESRGYSLLPCTGFSSRWLLFVVEHRL